MNKKNKIAISTLLTFSMFSATAANLDVNGDGEADILWRNQTTGFNWLWTMSGKNIVKSAKINEIPLDWDIAGRGDFNGDGKSDILWRNNKTGRNWIYLMDGFSISTSTELNYISDLSWQIKAVTDLNGDGKDDVIWRHAKTGRTWLYLMNGSSIGTSVGSQTVADLNWKIVATGDINADQFNDVIWRNEATGANYIWQMNGTSIKKQYVLNTVSSAWDIVGVGDFNSDSTDDILWRNNNDGRNWLYLMGEGLVSTSKLLNTIPSQDWQVRLVGDLNNDESDDVFWRNQKTGQSYIYLMNGSVIADQGWSTTIDTDWEVISQSTVARIKAVQDDCENDILSTCSIDLNSSNNGTIESNGDVDYFKTTITQAGLLTVYSSGANDINGSLYESMSETPLISDNDSGNENNFTLSYSVSEGDYYIAVSGDVGSYTITTEFTEEVAPDPANFYRENISQAVVQNKCVVCHTSTGVALSSRLHFERSTAKDYVANNDQVIRSFLNLSGVDSSYFLRKAIGELSHGGGPQVQQSSSEYALLNEYLLMIE